MKIVVCNLGYEDIEIHQLDQKEGTFPQLVKLIKSAIGKGKTEIEGYKITERNYINTGEEQIDIIKTEDFDRGIYIVNYGKGGKREGAGRPKSGREKKIIWVTPEENEKIIKYLEELREEL
jgi:hypothetical protein